MAASFNASSASPAAVGITLDPGVDSRIVSVSVKTRVASARQRKLSYAYPGLSGGGANAQGIAPVPIDWLLQIEFSSLANLTAWESDVYKILRAGGRYTLVSELGETRNNVWLDDYSRLDVNPIVGGSAWLLEATMAFGWMQP